MIDKRSYWFAILAGPGFFILPNGLTGNSTTEWIRSWSDETKRDVIGWLSDGEYEVRLMDISIWFEEEAVQRDFGLLSFAYQMLLQKLATERIALPDLDKGNDWSRGQEGRLSALHLAIYSP